MHDPAEILSRMHAAAEHHMNLPTLASQTDSENSHPTEELPTTISENSQPYYARTTNSTDVDDEGDNQDR